MAAGVADYTTIKKRVCSKLGIDPPDDLYSGNLETGEYAANEIRDAILEADSETYQAVAETPRHEARLRLGVVASPALTYTGEIPPDLPKHAGELGEVLVQFTGGAWKRGRPAKTPEQILAWRANVNGMYGAAADVEGYFHVTGNEVIDFTGLAAKVDYIPEYEHDRTTPACRCPESMQGHLVNGAVAKLRKDAGDTALFDASEGGFEKGLARIRARGMPGGEVMPDYQAARRRNAA